MADLARRAALRFISFTGIGAAVGLTTPAAESGSLALPPVGQSAQIGNSDPSPISWLEKERIVGGLKVMDKEAMVDMPAHIAALKSVRPWAKVLLARRYSDERQTFVDKLENALVRYGG